MRTSTSSPSSSSNRKVQGARENGRKSNGTITPAGKAKSRFNALRNGCTSHNAVLISTESEEDLSEFSQADFESLKSDLGLRPIYHRPDRRIHTSSARFWPTACKSP